MSQLICENSAVKINEEINNADLGQCAAKEADLTKLGQWGREMCSYPTLFTFVLGKVLEACASLGMNLLTKGLVHCVTHTSKKKLRKMNVLCEVRPLGPYCTNGETLILLRLSPTLRQSMALLCVL